MWKQQYSSHDLDGVIFYELLFAMWKYDEPVSYAQYCLAGPI